MIHTTIGIYLSGQFIINGVHPDHLESHIEYNKTARFGRGLFVDGKCVHKGYLTDEMVETFERQIAGDPERFTMKKVTAPYQ